MGMQSSDREPGTHRMPDLRVHPAGLAVAISTTSLRTSFDLACRPCPAPELSYFLATNWRNQASIVAGLTIWQHLRRSLGLSNLPALARWRRWWAVREAPLRRHNRCRAMTHGKGTGYGRVGEET
jgi:hypothetical protein